MGRNFGQPHRWFLILLVTIIFGSLASIAQDKKANVVQAILLVRDETGGVVEHAQVLSVTGDGVQSLGAYRDIGRLDLPNELLSEGEGALLVCAEGYYCGGWLAGDVALTSLEGSENPVLSIALAAIRLH